MNVKEYLKKYNLSASEFAKITNVPIVSIFRYARRAHCPHINRARHLIEITNGELTLEKLMTKSYE